MVRRPRGDEQAQRDNLGDDPGQVGPDSGGQAGDPQQLSRLEDAANESVEELADSDQAIEAARVEGIEDAADHPERPTHTHLEYGRPDDLPPARGSEDPEVLDETVPTPKAFRSEDDVKDVEDLSDEDRVA